MLVAAVLFILAACAPLESSSYHLRAPQMRYFQTARFGRRREKSEISKKTLPCRPLEFLLDVARPPGCLVSFVGVQRLLGSPFRIIDSPTAEADIRWLQERVEELTQPALRTFAYLGLESVDALGRRLVTNPDLYITENIAKVESSQVQSLLTSYCLATKLNHLARALPPAIVVPSLKKLESMQVEVYNSIVNNSFDDSHRARAILPRRFGGSAPGVSPIAPAAYLAAAIHFENFVCEWKGRVEIGPTNPYGLFSLVDRIKSRNSLPRDLYTETEKELLSASERINEAAGSCESPSPYFTLPPRSYTP